MGKLNSLTINGKRYNEFNGAGGGGGVSSWNDLPDRPFYVKEEGWEINFDPEAYTEPPAGSVQMSGTMWYVRVSDSTPSNEELKKCSATLVAINPDNPGEKITQTAALSTLWERYEAQGMITDEYANCEFGIIVRDVAAVNEMVGAGVFTMTGTYFMVEPNSQYLAKLFKPYDVQTLDPMFLPDTLIGRPGDGVGAEVFNNANSKASGDYSHAEGLVCYAGGEAAHAEGERCYAVGDSAHAEGYQTQSWHLGAHSEGVKTMAAGTGAHSEGNNTYASGDGCHAEGEDTIAQSFSSHAEGSGKKITLLLRGEGPVYTDCGTTLFGKDIVGALAIYSTDKGGTADGWVVAVSDELDQFGRPKTITIGDEYGIGSFPDYQSVDIYYTAAVGYGAHAEGERTIADGSGAHAEGVGTIARDSGQHVQGRYNVPDTEYKYAHIVGNGSDTYPDGFVRSNAHTLDWEGNAWYAGTVEATGIILKSSTPGSTKRFLLTVDDNGQPNIAEITD